MSYTLIINSNNISNLNTNTEWKYNFANGGFRLKNCEMCISNVTIPYSWYNVSNYYSNLTFQYAWYNGTIYTVTLPDGFYLISDINNYLQNYFISQNQYLINSSGQNVYFLVMVINSTYYSVQLLALVVPTSAQAATLLYTAPSGWSGYPGVATTGRFIISSLNNFGQMIGYSGGSYPATNQTSNYSITGDLTPKTPITSLILSSNLVDNPVTVPSNIIDSFSINATFGSNIIYNPSFPKWIKLNDGNFSNMVLTLTDQNNQTIYAKDGAGTITLLFREKNKFNSD